ncbi:PREDICTED: uncharacterized protein LOC109329342, partial [Lupinus angustifolius]|uniref:uncharacterized protein LOC109329342 n=1 Tax=Lupinus angustifolius TaxID=3871 RepID=UPI00092EAAE8
DDMLIACKNMSEIKSLKAQLSSEFEMKDLGAGRKILGMEIQRDRKEGTLFLSQKKYIEKVLERFGMQNAKPVTTPLASHFKLSMALCPQTESENEEMSSVPYASAVGSLMYAMICTRPDIAQAVSVVSRYMASPGKVHWKAVKWIMRYLKGTMDIGLLYGKVKGVGSKVIGYVDSDYAGDLDKRRSLTGYVFTLCGCTVSWKATLQSIVALSTTEAEYIAVTEAVKEAIWEKGLIEELGIQLEETTIYCDSQSAIHLTKNPMYHERTKHIDDDMLIACKNMSEIKSLKAQLSSEFEMKDLGAGRKILGMEIQRDRKEGTLFLSQKKYIEKVLERFGMQNAKPVTTPLASHFKLSMALCPQTESENEEMSSVPYASAVGSLMYAMICTRPDIAQAVSVVSRYMASPGKVHWKAVKWIMRYLKGTMDIGLLYGKVKGVGSKVIGYVDSDYAGDLDKRRSLTGYVFTLCGCTVSWKATLQSIVALSTTEAEYIAVTEAVKEAIWEKGLIEELGIQLEETTIYCDSQSAIHLTKNPMYHERTKHIDDDMLIACKNMSEIKSLKAQLSSEFEMKDLGAGRKILGMEIQRDRKEGTLFLSQKKYIEKVLERFGMQNAKPVTTPLASHFKLSMALCPQTESENEEMSSVPYASAVGSLMYAMICTRPDIAQAVSVVSRYMASPGKVHWKAVKWIMRYLKGTMDIGLLYGKVKGVGSKVIGYVDSDYAGDLDKRRSLTGYVFTLCGCTVSWKATLQSIVALSTTEAEYIAVTEAVKEAIWEKGLIEELGIQLEETTIYCDSQSAIHLTKNPMYHERTKHIDYLKNAKEKRMRCGYEHSST